MKLIAIVLAILAGAGALLWGFATWTRSGQPVSAPYAQRSGSLLQIHRYTPRNWSPNQKNTCVVFFFGGGWEVGSALQFEDHARRLARQGYVAITADYRTRRRHGTTPFESVTDAQEAIRWIREHASSLGIDPGKIIVAGGSSGGQLAASCAVFPEHENCRPNGLILLGAALDLDIPAVRNRATPDEATSLLRISPMHRLTEGANLPPTLILHGSEDGVIPVASVRAFADKAAALSKNQVSFVVFAGRSHEFYLCQPATRKDFERVMDRITNFLETEFGTSAL